MLYSTKTVRGDWWGVLVANSCYGGGCSGVSVSLMRLRMLGYDLGVRRERERERGGGGGGAGCYAC